MSLVDVGLSSTLAHSSRHRMTAWHGPGCAHVPHHAYHIHMHSMNAEYSWQRNFLAQLYIHDWSNLSIQATTNHEHVSVSSKNRSEYCCCPSGMGVVWFTDRSCTFCFFVVLFHICLLMIEDYNNNNSRQQCGESSQFPVIPKKRTRWVILLYCCALLLVRWYSYAVQQYMEASTASYAVMWIITRHDLEFYNNRVSCAVHIIFQSDPNYSSTADAERTLCYWRTSCDERQIAVGCIHKLQSTIHINNAAAVCTPTSRLSAY